MWGDADNVRVSVEGETRRGTRKWRDGPDGQLPDLGVSRDGLCRVRGRLV